MGVIVLRRPAREDHRDMQEDTKDEMPQSKHTVISNNIHIFTKPLSCRIRLPTPALFMDTECHI